MSYMIVTSDAIIDCFETQVTCPICTMVFDANKYDMRLYNARKGYITIICFGCKNRIGLTSGITGDFICFELESYRDRIRRKNI